MEPGFFVEFFEEKRLLLAVVLELKGERLHVLTQMSRELTLARKRVLYASPSRLPQNLSRREWLDYLKGTARKREDLKAAIQLAELWELMAQENEPLAAADMAELMFGGASPDQVAAMGRALHEDRYYFKYKDGLWVPNAPEVVEALMYKARREEEARRELAESRGLGWIGYALGVGIGAFIGLGRLYFGVHWPSDVAAGWALGAILSLGAVRWLGQGRARLDSRGGLL